MKKIMTVMGTRPEAIKLMPVLKEFDDLESVLVLTSQHKALVHELMPLFRLEVNHDLSLMQPGQTPIDLLSRGLPALDGVMDKEKPDLVLVQGDTSSALAGALAAFHRRIPVAHLEAGLRTGMAQDPFPEEMNRRLIGSLTEIHLAPTQKAVSNLIWEGVNPRKIRLCGNTIVDALDWVKRIGTRPPEEELRKKISGSDRIILLTCHRRESLGEPMHAIFGAVADLVRDYEDVLVVFPVHPNPRVIEGAHRAFQGSDRVLLVDPQDYFSFLWLLERAYLVITDSGGVQEEAPSFGVPVIVARDTTERMEGVEAGVAHLAGRTRHGIYNLSASLLSGPSHFTQGTGEIKNPYGDGKAAGRVREAIKEFLHHAAMVGIYS